MYADQLLNGQISIKNYMIDPGKVLVVVDDFSDGQKVMDFLLMQEGVVYLEVDSQKYYPKGKATTDQGKKKKKTTGGGDGEKREKSAETKGKEGKSKLDKTREKSKAVKGRKSEEL